MSTPVAPSPSLALSLHGTRPDGAAVQLFTLTNRRGHRVSLSEHGATIVDILVPDAQGVLADVNLGYTSLAGYVQSGNPFFGCSVGRCGNRIAQGRFNLDGKAYELACNNGENHLHGGVIGFDKRHWKGEAVGQQGVRFTYVSPDGEEGYPGTLRAEITFTWTEQSELRMDYVATTDKPTPVNLTNHAYFNLSGRHGTTVYDHRLKIDGDAYVPVSDKLIPTGELRPVAGTPMDFREARPIGERLQAAGGDPVGYDHTWVLRGGKASLRPVAEVFEPVSRRRLRVLTTEPGVQFYSGNFLDGSQVGKQGAAYPQHSGFCLETQHFPDSVNQPNFPSVILRPGETYRTTTVYAFDVV